MIANIAGIPLAANALEVRQYVTELQAVGHRFVLSAWNMYELARSNNQQHIDQCCAFVETLNPLWLSDSTKVKRQEVDRFLQPIFDNVGPVRNRSFSALNQTVAAMWGTYGEGGRPDETFTTSVALLRAHPEFLKTIDSSAKQTPEAILIGRRAYRDGAEALLDSIVDREYLALSLPAGADRLQLDYLMANRNKLLSVSPALAVEDAMSKLRVRDSFKPEPADAADLQHALVALGYCDYFVTGDRQLAQHCRYVVQKLGLACHVCRNVSDIPCQSMSG
ncbi:hypothetical protein [Rhodoferax sp. GW822-FHT02A01]|uniref:hypothetical protein n=1 Tax=Rhodoferax sp. GW822-FHT02A01 TaxID=3141537 RepID=UPI00315CE96F